MSVEITKPGSCQVDFYLLTESSADANRLACRLALMAWEREQSIFVIASSDEACEQLHKLMWEYPENRFLPHEMANKRAFSKAPVVIGTLSRLNPADVVINLCTEAVPQPEKFSRVLEIVPFAENERQASRVKYKAYINQGLKPQTHKMSTS